MKIKILHKEGLVLPKNAHESDTGYDLVAASDPKIVGVAGTVGYKSIDYIEYNTEVQIAPESVDKKKYGTCHETGRSILVGHERISGYTLVFPRSSLSKYNLSLANSVAIIDNSYRGNILLRFKYLWQPEDLDLTGLDRKGGVAGYVNLSKIYKKGDKIAQLVPAWKEDIQWEEVQSLDETARQSGGFGSTS